MRVSHNLAKSANQKIEGRPAPNPQRSLPTGPFGHVDGGKAERYERTPEDKAWHSEQLKRSMVIRNIYYRAVYQEMAFLGSCNPGRLFYAAHSTVACKLGVSVKTVQRAVGHFKREGVLRVLSVGSGRTTGTYQLLGVTVTGTQSPCRVDSESMQGGLRVHQLKEGRKQSSKKLLKEPARAARMEEDHLDPTKDHSDPLGSEKASQKQEKAPVPKKQGPTSDPTPVDKYFKLLRKLNYEAYDELGIAFEKLPHHRDRKAILDGLEAEERDLAHQGKLSFAPVPMPKRLGELPPTAVTAAFEARYSAACAHIPADDLPVNCDKCGAYIGGA